MSEQKQPDDQECLSLNEMQNWLRQEIADLAKAVSLRTKEATALVDDYSAGTISPEEAQSRLWKYGHRWPEALPGTHTIDGVSDGELVAEIDAARHPQFVERLLKKNGKRSAQKGNSSETL